MRHLQQKAKPPRIYLLLLFCLPCGIYLSISGSLWLSLIRPESNVLDQAILLAQVSLADSAVGHIKKRVAKLENKTYRSQLPLAALVSSNRSGSLDVCAHLFPTFQNERYDSLATLFPTCERAPPRLTV
jgi:hypothetical protein